MPQLLANPVVRVSVTVVVEDDGTVNITCTKNPVPVDGFHTLIVFSLDTPGYRFRTTNAIELDTPHPDFPFPSWTVTPTLATLVDLCNTEDTFKYTVNIVDTITDAAYSVDPEIKNGDGSSGGKP